MFATGLNSTYTRVKGETPHKNMARTYIRRQALRKATSLTKIPLRSSTRRLQAACHYRSSPFTHILHFVRTCMIATGIQYATPLRHRDFNDGAFTNTHCQLSQGFDNGHADSSCTRYECGLPGTYSSALVCSAMEHRTSQRSIEDERIEHSNSSHQSAVSSQQSAVSSQQSAVSSQQQSHLKHCLEDGDEHAGSALAQLLERVDGLRINANAVQQRVDACLHKTATGKRTRENKYGPALLLREKMHRLMRC